MDMFLLALTLLLAGCFFVGLLRLPRWLVPAALTAIAAVLFAWLVEWALRTDFDEGAMFTPFQSIVLWGAVIWVIAAVAIWIAVLVGEAGRLARSLFDRVRMRSRDASAS